MPPVYIGRFAPSPTGPLHLGSLLTALASYLDAKHQNGTWFIRIEDLDPPREVPGASQRHIDTLKRFGMVSDGTVLKQSQRLSIYQSYLDKLAQKDMVYSCACTRKDLLPFGGKHPYAECPSKAANATKTSIRLKTPDLLVVIQDGLQPSFTTSIRQASGDFILQRKDKLFAYHLAVTVDDHLQSITHIVRGGDLLSSTPQQHYLQQQLGFSHPYYFHLPTITHRCGSKLSKQTFAKSIEQAPVIPTLISLLDCLGQRPPVSLQNKSVKDVLNWAIEHWSRNQVPTKRTIEAAHIEQTLGL